MMRTRPITKQKGHLLSTIALSSAGLLLLAACSTAQQGAATGTTSAKDSDCKNAAAAQAKYTETWNTTAKAFGLTNFTPVKEKVCDVDTSVWAKKPSQGNTYRIAFAAQGPINSWGMLSEEAFKIEAKTQGVDVLYASANGDATVQVDNIQQLASQSPDAMVVVPMGAGITAQVAATVAQGIPVVLCSGILPESSKAVSTVTRQYDLLGSAYAEWLVNKLGGKGEVAILSGLAGVPTAEYQAAAAKLVFAKYPGIKVVTQAYTQWSPTVAKTVAQNLITRFPNLAGIWSDSGYGDLGVVQAYREAGKPIPPMTGDAINAFLRAVHGKDVKFALSSFPPEQSQECLRTALNILKGKPVLNKVYIDSPSFTNEQADNYVRLDCNDNLFIPSSLDKATLIKLKLCS